MTTSRTATKETAGDNSSMNFISQIVASGLSNSFASLKDKVSLNIKDNGEQYLSDSLEKLKKTAAKLTGWSKENPVKTAIAIAAVLAVTAFLVSATKGSMAAPKRTTKSVNTLRTSRSTPRIAASPTAPRKNRAKPTKST